MGKLRLRERKEYAPGNTASVTTYPVEPSREATQRDAVVLRVRPWAQQSP